MIIGFFTNIKDSQFSKWPEHNFWRQSYLQFNILIRYMNKSKNIKSVVVTKSIHYTCAGKNDFYWFYCHDSIVIFMFRRKCEQGFADKFLNQNALTRQQQNYTTHFLTAKKNQAISIYRVINLLNTIHRISAWNLPIIHLNNIYYIICFSIIRVHNLSPLGFESTRFLFIIFHTYIRYLSVFPETNQIRPCCLFVMIFQFLFLYIDRNNAHACTFNTTVN